VIVPLVPVIVRV
jgi:hypothetical protein